MSQQAPSLSILPKLIEALRSARYVVVLTGAGVSAESNIPTFREAQTGLWAKYSPEELATPRAFAADPELVWRWYDWRRGLIAAAEPNAAHRALAELEQRCRLTLVTQNVDGFHQQAGSRRALEFHGSIWVVRCLDCGAERLDRTVPIPILPTCEECGGVMVIRIGRSGPFLGCGAFPRCKATQPLPEGMNVPAEVDGG